MNRYDWRTLSPLPGGRDDQPHTAHTLRPSRRRPSEIPDHGAHVTNLRPTAHEQALDAGHPSSLPPYDHAGDLGRPAIPSLVEMALDRIGHFIRVPGGQISRPQAVEALDVVAAWMRPDLTDDWCNPAGIDRPVS